MSFDKALAIVSRNPIARLVTPNWMYKLPVKLSVISKTNYVIYMRLMIILMNSLRELDEAYRSLSQYMNSFVSRRKEEISSETYNVDAKNSDDLFTSLVRANVQDGKFGLSDKELVTLSSSDSMLPVLI